MWADRDLIFSNIRPQTRHGNLSRPESEASSAVAFVIFGVDVVGGDDDVNDKSDGELVVDAELLPAIDEAVVVDVDDLDGDPFLIGDFFHR